MSYSFFQETSKLPFHWTKTKMISYYIQRQQKHHALCLFAMLGHTGLRGKWGGGGGKKRKRGTLEYFTDLI